MHQRHFSDANQVHQRSSGSDSVQSSHRRAASVAPDYSALRYDQKIGTMIRRKGTMTRVEIGDYVMLEKVGKGAFGVVYKGMRQADGEMVAIKRLKKEGIDEHILRSLQGEIELLRQLDHPNLVKYVGLIDSDNHVNLILEFVDGGSLLQHVIRQGGFAETVVQGYVLQTLRALAYLHDRGVVHRDIKAGNVLVTKDNRIKLGDFGIATTAEGGGSEDVLCEGSPFWMAPEVIELQPTTTASDLWSLGCTIIELLTGQPPYFDMPAMSALFKMVREDHPPLPHTSPECQDFLLSCFKKVPSERATAAALLQHPWLNVRSAPSSPSPSSPHLAQSPKGSPAIISSSLREASHPIAKEKDHVQNNVTVAPPSSHSSSSTNNGTAGKAPNSSSLPRRTNRYLTPPRDRRVANSDEGSSDESESVSMTEEALVSSGSAGDDDLMIGVGSGRYKAADGNRSVSKLRDQFENKATKSSNEYVVLVTGFETRKNKFLSYTVFRLKVCLGSEKWTVFKTYTDFRDFAETLKKTMKSMQRSKIKTPVLPGAKMFGKEKIQFLKRRREKLEKYLRDLLAIPQVVRTGVLSQFLAEDGPDAASTSKGAEPEFTIQASYSIKEDN